MKNISIILTLVLTICFVGNTGAQDLIQILKDKNYSAIEGHMQSKVKVEIDRKKEVLTSAKALQLLKKKLEDFSPVKYEPVHKGTSEGNDGKYTIAKIYNQNGDGLRVFISMDTDSGSKKISSIRIRKLL